MKYCGVDLQPGACMSDHSAAFRNAYVLTWPLAELGQCYPHIIRKFGEGAYCLKTYKNFDEAQLHITQLHLCPTTEAKTLMIQEVGKVHVFIVFTCIFVWFCLYSSVFICIWNIFTYSYLYMYSCVFTCIPDMYLHVFLSVFACI